jgi:hypothetical protein
MQLGVERGDTERFCPVLDCRIGISALGDATMGDILKDVVGRLSDTGMVPGMQRVNGGRM